MCPYSFFCYCTSTEGTSNSQFGICTRFPIFSYMQKCYHLFKQNVYDVEHPFLHAFLELPMATVRMSVKDHLQGDLPYFQEYKTIFFFPSPWVPTYSIDTTYLSFFSKKKLGKNNVFKQNYEKKLKYFSNHAKHNRKRKNNPWDIPNQT